MLFSLNIIAALAQMLELEKAYTDTFMTFLTLIPSLSLTSITFNEAITLYT